ncbi:hypothetical protein D9M68_511220 [compost metagenome]
MKAKDDAGLGQRLIQHGPGKGMFGGYLGERLHAEVVGFLVAVHHDQQHWAQCFQVYGGLVGQCRAVDIAQDCHCFTWAPREGCAPGADQLQPGMTLQLQLR